MRWTVRFKVFIPTCAITLMLLNCTSVWGQDAFDSTTNAPQAANTGSPVLDWNGLYQKSVYAFGDLNGHSVSLALALKVLLVSLGLVIAVFAILNGIRAARIRAKSLTDAAARSKANWNVVVFLTGILVAAVGTALVNWCVDTGKISADSIIYVGSPPKAFGRMTPIEPPPLPPGTTPSLQT